MVFLIIAIILVLLFGIIIPSAVRAGCKEQVTGHIMQKKELPGNASEKGHMLARVEYYFRGETYHKTMLVMKNADIRVYLLVNANRPHVSVREHKKVFVFHICLSVCIIALLVAWICIL